MNSRFFTNLAGISQVVRGQRLGTFSVKNSNK
eukprot:UN08277